jgi:hypothetical protein
MIFHVDNCYTIGDEPNLQNFEKELSDKRLKLKISNVATNYLSCDLKIDKNNKTAWIGQTTLIRKAINKFSPMVNKGKFHYKTPGTPKQQIKRPSENDPELTPQQQTEY